MKIVVALLALLVTALPAAAQDWPTRPVKIVVPFGPGSTPDVVARLIADHLQKKLGQPFTIRLRKRLRGRRDAQFQFVEIDVRTR